MSKNRTQLHEKGYFSADLSGLEKTNTKPNAMDAVLKKAKQDDSASKSTTTEKKSEPLQSEATSKKMEVSEYVLVTDPSGEVLEIPTNSDNSVFMATLQATVAGATGLKFRNPKTGASRAVVVDPTGTKLLPPSDGWDDKTFMAIVANAPSRGPDVSVKRRKMGGSDGEDELEEDGRLGRKRLLESSPLAAKSTPGRKTAVPEHRKPVDLIVLGVSYKTTEQQFRHYFEQLGQVTFAEIKKNADGQSKGFGFVQMSNIEDQDKVLSLGQHTIDGRRCDIKIPEQRQDSPGERSDYYSNSRQGRANKIFVGRMTDKINEKSLRDYFTKKATSISPSCTVSDVFIPSPFRGFAFVTLSNADVASKICSHKSYVINDVSVAVSLAVPRDEMAKDSPQSGQSTGYYNDFGYSYGYGRGSPFPAPNYAPPFVNDQYGYGSPAPPAAYPGGSWQTTPTRPPPNSWVPAPRTSMSPLPPTIHYRGQPGPSSGPPNMPPHMPPALPLRGDGVSHSVGNQIASGLDALNLNQRNPEVVSAAWNSFLTTLNNQQQNHNGGGHQWNG